MKSFSENLMRPAVVVESRAEGSVMRAIRIVRPDLHANIATISAYQRPGQFVIVSQCQASEGAFFVISNPPSPDGTTLELLVKPRGLIAEAVARTKVGDVLWMSDPLGDGFPKLPERNSPVVVFAAGSGVAATRALVANFVAYRSRVGTVRLFYGQSGESEFAYRDWLCTLGSCGVNIELVLSKHESGWTGPVGYVQGVADRDDVFSMPSETYVYVCGMDEMVQGVRELCARRGVPADHVFTNLPG